MFDVRTPPRPPGAAPPRRSRWHWSTIPLLVAIAAGLAALAYLFATADDESSSSGPVTTVSSGPVVTTTTVDLQAEAKAAILEAHRVATAAFVAVGSDPNARPDDPRLEQHKIGAALLASQASIDRLRKAGQVFRGAVEVHPTVIELSSDTATVEDCAVDRVSIVDVATGLVIEPEVAAPSAAQVSFKLVDGVWKQNAFVDLKRSCTPAS